MSVNPTAQVMADLYIESYMPGETHDFLSFMEFYAEINPECYYLVHIRKVADQKRDYFKECK